MLTISCAYPEPTKLTCELFSRGITYAKSVQKVCQKCAKMSMPNAYLYMRTKKRGSSPPKYKEKLPLIKVIAFFV